MPKQEFVLLDYFGPVVVAAIFSFILFVISFFCINFFCITKHDDFTVFEKNAARFRMKMGPHSLRSVRAVLYDESGDEESLYSTDSVKK